MAKKVEETNPAVTAEGPEIGLTITKVDPKEFGLEEKNTKSISDAFLPKIAERDGYIGVYKNILTMDISDETCKQARRLRLDLVPVRTGIEKIRKAEKESLVAEGKYIDALAKKHSLPIEQMEEKLQEIENHFENIEKERKRKLKAARLILLSDFPDFDPEFVDLENMDAPTFEKLLKQQEDLKQFKAEQAIKQQQEEDAKQRKAELEEQRTAETVKYSDFIVNYENIFLSELPEEEYQALLAKAKADKQADDEQKAKIKADNTRLEAENKAIADKAAKEQADLATKLKTEQDKAAKDKAEADAKIKALEKEKADKEAADKAKKAEEEKAAIKAAKAPDKDKLNKIIDDAVLILPREGYKSPEAEQMETNILNKFNAFKKWAKEEIEKL